MREALFQGVLDLLNGLRGQTAFHRHLPHGASILESFDGLGVFRQEFLVRHRRPGGAARLECPLFPGRRGDRTADGQRWWSAPSRRMPQTSTLSFLPSHSASRRRWCSASSLLYFKCLFKIFSEIIDILMPSRTGRMIAM